MSRTGAISKHPKKTGAAGKVKEASKKVKAKTTSTSATKLPVIKKGGKEGTVSLSTIKRVVKTVSDARKKK